MHALTYLPLAELSTVDILLIVFVFLLLFGSAKLPQLARSLGSSIKEFKKGAREDIDDDPAKPAAHEAEKPKTGKE